jgi:hypothetical protein
MVTESDDLARTLDSAALLWPELANDRAALLRKILEVGSQAILASQSLERQQKLAAISQVRGSLPGIWDGFREEQLSSWPE